MLELRGRCDACILESDRTSLATKELRSRIDAGGAASEKSHGLRPEGQELAELQVRLDVWQARFEGGLSEMAGLGEAVSELRSRMDACQAQIEGCGSEAVDFCDEAVSELRSRMDACQAQIEGCLGNNVPRIATPGLQVSREQSDVTVDDIIGADDHREHRVDDHRDDVQMATRDVVDMEIRAEIRGYCKEVFAQQAASSETFRSDQLQQLATMRTEFHALEGSLKDVLVQIAKEQQKFEEMFQKNQDDICLLSVRLRDAENKPSLSPIVEDPAQDECFLASARGQMAVIEELVEKKSASILGLFLCRQELVEKKSEQALGQLASFKGAFQSFEQTFEQVCEQVASVEVRVQKNEDASGQVASLQEHIHEMEQACEQRFQKLEQNIIQDVNNVVTEVLGKRGAEIAIARRSTPQASRRSDDGKIETICLGSAEGPRSPLISLQASIVSVQTERPHSPLISLQMPVRTASVEVPAGPASCEAAAAGPPIGKVRLLTSPNRSDARLRHSSPLLLQRSPQPLENLKASALQQQREFEHKLQTCKQPGNIQIPSSRLDNEEIQRSSSANVLSGGAVRSFLDSEEPQRSSSQERRLPAGRVASMSPSREDVQTGVIIAADAQRWTARLDAGREDIQKRAQVVDSTGWAISGRSKVASPLFPSQDAVRCIQAPGADPAATVRSGRASPLSQYADVSGGRTSQTGSSLVNAVTHRGQRGTSPPGSIHAPPGVGHATAMPAPQLSHRMSPIATSNYRNFQQMPQGGSMDVYPGMRGGR